MEKLVSVIIPSYNRYKYLLKAIESVKNQTHKNIQLIVINDGSTQIEYYQPELYHFLPKNSLLIHNNNKISGDGKTANARNLGIKVANGEYIAFLDDDDLWIPTKLTIQLSYMSDSNKMSCTEGFIENKKYLSEYHKDVLQNMGFSFPLPNVWSKKFLQKHNCCITSSVVIEKSIIDKIGFMSLLRVGEDYDYWLRALEHTNCVFVDNPLIIYDSKHGDGVLY